MEVKTDLIKELLKTKSQAEIVRGTGIIESQISRIVNGQTSLENMRVRTAYTLTVYAEHIINTRRIIQLYKEYDDEKELLGIFLYTKDLVDHLKANDYYEWTEKLDDFKKPDYSQVTTLSKLKSIFEEHEVNGFRLTIEVKNS